MNLFGATRRQARLLICAIFFFLHCISISIAFNASVDLRVLGDGFHRRLEYHVNIGNLTKENCYVALFIEFSSALYVNVDELADLHRFEKEFQNVVCSVGETNIELFAEKAMSQNVTVCSLLNNITSILTIPIHQRYQNAREGGGYINVSLPSPKLLLGCKERVKGYRVSKVELCLPCADLVTKWREIPYYSTTCNYVWQVPVGDLSHLTLVTNVTLLLTSLGALFALKRIWSNRSSRSKKEN
ncbi:phosphatidylinositol-glycan biosynthesis class X protein-like [Cephus cinctus]|uniref:Phosphatidylinositol-glycan biosynthesis class X protein n=1 Tax=Cephus cinctus TaxID=211228 RepID=A0AAJ7BYD8_CEPCN|nr:phosphatidylinositol-glycan biosynthesis class X protein-like [Cephus cinctus]